MDKGIIIERESPPKQVQKMPSEKPSAPRPASEPDSSWKALLFPEPERRFPGERMVRVLLRTAHIAAMALLIGGHYFEVYQERLAVPLMAALGTGVLFMVLELYGTCNWLFEVRGILTLLKVALLFLIPFYWDQRFWVLLTVLVIASISSHMPSKVRYWSILTRRDGEHKKG